MEKVILDVNDGSITVVPFTPEEEAEFWARRLPLAWDDLRSQRNSLLVESDPMVLPDKWEFYSPELKQQWAAYRQALRDLPENTTDPFNPVWPAKPE